MAIRVLVRVKPGAARPRVGGRHGDPPALIVAVHAQAVEGQANAAVIASLAKALGLHPRELSIISGHASRTKVIEATIEDSQATAVQQRIAALLAGS